VVQLRIEPEVPVGPVRATPAAISPLCWWSWVPRHPRPPPGSYELAARLRCPHVVLTHITRRTPIREARRLVQQVVGKQEMERLEIFMDRGPQRRPSADLPVNDRASTR